MVDKNLPVNAGDTSLIPGQGRFHMSQSNQDQVPQLLSPSLSLCSVTREATALRTPCAAMKSGPHSPQLERAFAKTKQNKTKHTGDQA